MHTCISVKSEAFWHALNSLLLKMRKGKHWEFPYRVRALQSWKQTQEEQLFDCRLHFSYNIPDKSVAVLPVFIPRMRTTTEAGTGPARPQKVHQSPFTTKWKPLTLEQLRSELHRSTYTQIFFNYVYWNTFWRFGTMWKNIFFNLL